MIIKEKDTKRGFEMNNFWQQEDEMKFFQKLLKKHSPEQLFDKLTKEDLGNLIIKAAKEVNARAEKFIQLLSEQS